MKIRPRCGIRHEFQLDSCVLNDLDGRAECLLRYIIVE